MWLNSPAKTPAKPKPNVTTNSNNFAIELKEAKAKEAAAAKAKGKSNPAPSKPVTTGTASNSKSGSAQASSFIFNKVAKTAKTAAVGVFNFVIGDDAKATFGKNSSTTERVIGGASLILTVATLGEGKLVTSGLKGAGKLAGKVFAKDVAETVVVRETAATIGAKRQQGLGVRQERKRRLRVLMLSMVHRKRKASLSH